MSLRIGLGYDVHAFALPEANRPLMLGGVKVEHDKGLLGHSDADVLIHAIADAMLGAARLGDIGQHFPDTDPTYLGADSLELLAKVNGLIAEAGFSIVDIDCVIQAEKPKLAPYREQMRKKLANCLGVDMASIGIKATTTEGLGAIGRAEGIAATAVALLIGNKESHAYL
ncbi:MAG: 2-C-methyl-D-erythritol 2,4-cyclodiphosphate synthase [Coriobacteriia bacterium]|nr:2-C-methyl-D-erythritol 2,4-cyclodiphosphate synthase [Coriobacteriia bacterium]